jgi:membrane protease YdiL (CAAX protease family)
MNPSARRSVVFYIATVIVAAWLWMLSFRIGFHPPNWVALFVLMWIPGLASVMFRLIGKEGFRDVGWAIGKARYWAWAYLGPLSLAALSFLVASLFGKVAMTSHLADQPMLDAALFNMSWFIPDASSAGLLTQRFLSVAFVGIIPGFIFALGEELGWRGYLLTRLVKTGWPYPMLLSGVVWGIWHLPLFILTGYAHGAVIASVVMFTLMTTLFGVFIGWLRLASGSVWVATMAHASFNGFVQSFFVVSFNADKAWFWIGDYGIFVLIPYALLAAWLYNSGRVRAALSRILQNRRTG